MQKFVPRSCVGIFHNERTRSTPLDSKLFVFVQFVLFWCIWDYLVALQNSVQNGQNCCKSSFHEVTSEFFAMKASDPTHWNLNSRFGAFPTIWVHLGLFGCHTTLSAKRVNWCKSSCHKVALEFFAMNAPDPSHGL